MSLRTILFILKRLPRRSYFSGTKSTKNDGNEQFIKKTTEQLQKLKEKLEDLEKTKIELEDEIHNVSTYLQNFEKFTSEQINEMKKRKRRKSIESPNH